MGLIEAGPISNFRFWRAPGEAKNSHEMRLRWLMLAHKCPKQGGRLPKMHMHVGLEAICGRSAHEVLSYAITSSHVPCVDIVRRGKNLAQPYK